MASAGLYASLHLIPDNHANIPPLSFFTGRMPFLTPNQQRQSNEGNNIYYYGNNCAWEYLLITTVFVCEENWTYGNINAIRQLTWVSGSPNRQLNSSSFGPSLVNISPAYNTPATSVQANIPHYTEETKQDQTLNWLIEWVFSFEVLHHTQHTTGQSLG